VQNVSGRAENSIRVNGTASSRVENVRFKNVAVKFARWTKYPGGVYDNRPTKVLTPVEPHAPDGFNLRHAGNVSLENCALGWKEDGSAHFADAVRAEDVRDLTVSDFSGDSTAHPIQVR
jgi:hypothetical protein